MRTHKAVVVAFLATVSLAGCSSISDALDHGDTFEDRQQALNSVYEQGKSARTEMVKLGIVVNQKSCDNSWVTSGARDAEKNSMIAGVQDRASNKNFQNLRHLSFINGCLDRPNRISPTSAPSLEPDPSTSPTHRPKPSQSTAASSHPSHTARPSATASSRG